MAAIVNHYQDCVIEYPGVYTTWKSFAPGVKPKYGIVIFKDRNLHLSNDISWNPLRSAGMGGILRRFPSGAFHVSNLATDWHFTFEQAADAAQAWQRKKYEECREFVMQYEKEQGKPTTLTPELLADALDCFWNAAIGHAHNAQSTLAMDTAGSMAEGFAAIANRLRGN